MSAGKQNDKMAEEGQMMLQVDGMIDNLTRMHNALVQERKRIQLERKEVELNRRSFNMEKEKLMSGQAPRHVTFRSPTGSGTNGVRPVTSPLQIAIEAAHDEIRQFRSVLSSQVRTIRSLGSYSGVPSASPSAGSPSLLSQLPSVSAISGGSDGPSFTHLSFPDVA